jgi:amino acid transporter
VATSTCEPSRTSTTPKCAPTALARQLTSQALGPQGDLGDLFVTTEQRPATVKVVVATTVMLSFISFWRAAAIVLSDLASSAYYVGGIAEPAVGKAAPWFILAIMLFSYAVRAIYIESCSMFVRGGVYKVVHEAMGGTLAKFSVSALMFDYVLTGPISAVSAGLYLGGLINEIRRAPPHRRAAREPPYFAAVFAAVVTLYFWRKNIIGMHESSEKALRIMQITTVMVVILIVWCIVTILKNGYQPVPLPTRQPEVQPRSAGLAEGHAGALHHRHRHHDRPGPLAAGHERRGEPGAGQPRNRPSQAEEPGARRLRDLHLQHAVHLAGFLLRGDDHPRRARPQLPGQPDRRPFHVPGRAGGPARLLFHGFVVLVGTLILSGAVNTAIIGSNGVLNRVAEDGVLPDWFRHPHKKFGTTSRLINLIVGLQLITIVISRGDVYMLGEAYAFGVVWSFAMKALSVLVLRYKQPGGREWKVPLNFHIGKTEIPLGLMMITVTLFALAIINVLTKKVATISGVSFTIAFFIVFELSDLYNRKRKAAHGPGDGEVPPGYARGSYQRVRPRAARQRAGGRAQSQPPAAPGAHPAKDRHAQDGHRGALRAHPQGPPASTAG